MNHIIRVGPAEPLLDVTRNLCTWGAPAPDIDVDEFEKEVRIDSTIDAFMKPSFGIRTMRLYQRRASHIDTLTITLCQEIWPTARSQDHGVENGTAAPIRTSDLACLGGWAWTDGYRASALSAGGR